MAEDNIPRTNVSRYFETGQFDLTTAAKVYEIAKLHGGEAVVIKAKVGNTGLVHVGLKDVSATTGFELSAGESIKIEYSPDKVVEEFILLYAVAVTSGDDVCIIRVP